MTDLHPWEVLNSPLTGKFKQPLDSSIVLRTPGAGEEVIRLNKDGFHYRGQLIEDAGEAHCLMVAFLRQNTVPALAEQPVGPTDEELDEFAVFWWGSDTDERTVTNVIECCSMAAFARAVLARWGQS
jgi:hypothetical protein